MVEVLRETKLSIFMLNYNTQFLSYENITNVFWVRFDLLKHLRKSSEPFEQHKIILARLKFLYKASVLFLFQIQKKYV